MSVAPKEAEPASFGDLLRQLRLASGLSQEALAELAHMSSGGISVLERGTRRAPQRDTVTLLANALELSTEDRLRFEQAARRSGSARRRSKPNLAEVTEVGNLPFALTSFVGRERTSDWLRSTILDQRLVTVTGVGGAGKTRLAIEVAHGLGVEFPDGVWLVELAPLADAARVASHVASVLGVSAEGSPPSDAWIDELSDRRSLVILDNCEHVLQACASIVRPLLERCARMHVVATSREPLRVTGERVVRLEPLTELQSMELFADRARYAAPEFQAAEDEDASRGYLRSICRALDGIPLALELAAARFPALSLKAIADNLDKRLSLLRRGDRSAQPRQQTMRALIDWSYDLLTVDERKVFNRLSIFAGGCSAACAASVCSADGVDESVVLDLLTSLVDKSMIVVDVQIAESRYGMLEITAEYAREKLESSGERERLAGRHALAYLELAKSLQHRESMTDLIWRSRVQPELENWRLALQWALAERNDVPLGQNLAAVLWPVWMTFASSEGRRWVRTATELAGESTPAELRARLQYTEALFALRASEDAVALEAAQKVLPEYERLQDKAGAARARKIVGMSMVYLGRPEEGESVLLEALAGAKAANDVISTASIEDCLGSARSVRGDFQGAKTHFARAQALYEAAGSERDALYARVGLAEAYFRAGDAQGALQIASEALENARGLSDSYVTMAILTNIAEYLIALERFEDAYSPAREAVELASASNFEIALSLAMACLAAASVLRMAEGNSANADFVKWARIVGFVQKRVGEIGAQRDPAIDSSMRRCEAALRKHFDPIELAALTETGSTMTSGAAVALALKPKP